MRKLKVFFKRWWLMIIIGLLSIVLGIDCIANPLLTAELASTLIIAFFIAQGVMDILFILIFRKGLPAWGWNLLGAIAFVIMGISIAGTPGSKEALMLILFGSGFILEAAHTISLALVLKRSFVKEWFLVFVFGILTFIMAIILMINPTATFLTIGFMAGFELLSTGISLITTGIFMSKVNSAIKKAEELQGINQDPVEKIEG